MTLKRLAAFAVAVALVVGALFLRGALDDKSQGSTANDEPTNSGTYRLICSTEFEAVCESIADADDEVEVTIEPAGKTLDRLAKADVGAFPDAWITLDPFPAMLDETRTRGTDPLPKAVKSSALIGSATANVAVVDIKADALRSACAQESIAACAGRLTGKTWNDLEGDGIEGQVNVGINDPATGAVGLISFGNGVAGLVGSTDFDARRLEENDVRVWTRNVVVNSQVLDARTTPLITMILRPSVDIAFSTSTETAENPSGDRRQYEIIAVEPAFQLSVVLAVLGNEDDDVRSQAASALDAAGWEPSADHTPLPASTFINLRNLWESN